MSLARSHIGRDFEGKRGLSLQEMLIVVAVFGILAVIFFFSSSQVLVKTQTSRVKQDHKTLSVALNAYLGENSEYPSTESGWAKLLGENLISDIPRDPFSPNDEPYHYYAFASRESSQPYCLIISAGPDGDIDFDLGDNNGVDTGEGAGAGGAASIVSISEFALYMSLKHYDPTNGVVSDGDIIEFR
jgi:prepilin-type N-terminal cleavage/methylation domain-containing protein